MTPLVARLHNLATVLHDLGDLLAGRDSFERALAIVEAQLSPTHPNTVTVRQRGRRRV